MIKRKRSWLLHLTALALTLSALVIVIFTACIKLQIFNLFYLYKHMRDALKHKALA